MAASVCTTGSGLQVGPAQPVFQFRSAGISRSNYDVMPDGQRFLFITRAEETNSAAITVVMNWDRR